MAKAIPHRILSVTEEELARIVLDIHDGPVQYLFASLSLLTNLERQCSAPNSTSTELLPTIHQVSGMIESALHEIKSFVGTFRPPEFNRRPLASIIEGLIIQHEGWTGQTVELEIRDLPDVPLPIKITFYRIVQEALSNCYRHAGVDQLSVHLWNKDNCLWLRVEDQGKGFTPPPLHGPHATEREEHIGLRGMRDRIELLGGRFHLSSEPGKGTRITVKVPIHA